MAEFHPPEGLRKIGSDVRFVHRETGRVKHSLIYPDDGPGKDWRIECRDVYVTPWSPFEPVSSTGEEKTDGD